MSAYQSLAISYDRLTRDVPYGEIFSLFRRFWQSGVLRPALL